MNLQAYSLSHVCILTVWYNAHRVRDTPECFMHVGLPGTLKIRAQREEITEN